MRTSCAYYECMTTTQTPSKTTAHAVLQQVELGVKMSLGMRDLVALDNGLQARVGPGSRRLWVEVTLNALDLWDVRLARLPRGGCELVTVLEKSCVHADDLSRTLLAVEREGWGS